MAPDDAHPFELKRQRILMAAPYNVILRGADEQTLEHAARDLFLEARKREELLSRFLPDSEICILNHLAATRPIRVEPTTFELLLRCREYWTWSRGAMDITVAPLLELWDVTGAGRVPGDDVLAEVLQRVGMDKVLFEEAASLVAFANEGVLLDLGGVGKGTAVDDGMALLMNRWSVPEAYLSLGRSTIGVVGTWRAEILSPADERTPVLTVDLHNEALSMSSIGPRRFVHRAYANKSVDHIIDPRTGQARCDIVSVTAVGPKAEPLDALTTALIVSGEDDAPPVAAAFGARQVIFVRPAEGGATLVRTLDVAAGAWSETAS